MVLLRESSEVLDQKIDLNATVGGSGADDIEHGDAMAKFAEAVCKGEGVDDSRAVLRELLSEDAFYLAACIVGIFNGLVRTADFSGIPLDQEYLNKSSQERDSLGLNSYAGAVSSDVGS